MGFDREGSTAIAQPRQDGYPAILSYHVSMSSKHWFFVATRYRNEEALTILGVSMPHAWSDLIIPGNHAIVTRVGKRSRAQRWLLLSHSYLCSLGLFSTNP